MPPVFPRPEGFRPVNPNALSWARFEFTGPFLGPPPRQTGARAAGLRYERKAHRGLADAFPPEGGGPIYAAGQWIAFAERGGPKRWAQPDGMLLDFSRGLITIVEIKLRHMQRAWWWLRELYEPLIRFIFPKEWAFACLEVVRYYDPAVSWPEPLRLARSPADLSPGQFGCHIWSGTRG